MWAMVCLFAFGDALSTSTRPRVEKRRENKKAEQAKRHRVGDDGPPLRRRLSQHFLVDAGVASTMADECTAGSVVVELGAGATGAITRHLVAGAASAVVAVEVDASAAATLLEGLPGLDVRVMDALDIDWPSVAGGGRACVVSNLPFGGASRLLYSLLDAAPSIERCVLLMQRELAERLCAPHGDEATRRGGGGAYSSLSVEFQLRCASPPQITLRPPRQAFVPPPKVDTAVVVLDFDAAQCALLEATALCRRELLTAAFSRRTRWVKESWLPLGLDALNACDQKLLEKEPWELAPAQFHALSLALAEVHGRFAAAGGTLVSERTVAPPKPKPKSKLGARATKRADVQRKAAKGIPSKKAKAKAKPREEDYDIF
ncbi:S-adenosyl-L-methionine-dependent methyltransferase [Pelagophyceae sp. CCMP2097]|nr:S-adenosyl-L-methionine-dependent methyltransferase [Pelagophyceae sp. CCMP2097]